MAQKAKTLNIADIFRFRKDLLWGKYYYGLIESGEIKDCLLFRNPYESKKIIEILSIDNKNQELVKDFTTDYAKKIRYFIQELNESTQVEDIEFITKCGFRRYNRNYCFKCSGTENSLKDHKQLNVFCREMNLEDVNFLVDLDQDCQIIDFRDALFKPKKFFKNHFEDILVFSSPIHSEEIYAYAYRPDPEIKDVFEFVLHPNRSNIIYECISAFNEKYVHFEKTASSFSFIINENQKSELDSLRDKHELEWVSQKLILEGCPKSKMPKANKAIVFKTASA